MLSSLAQGKSFVYRDTEEGEEAKTVRDVMNDTFATAFIRDGFLWVTRNKTGQKLRWKSSAH